MTTKNKSLVSKGPDDCFNLFIFHGSVSLTGREEDQQHVKVLRDTGGSQSFVLADVLPFSPKSVCEVSIVVSGIEMGCAPAPLHNVYVKSGLVSGCFAVTVLLRFPIEGEFYHGK